ncbi:hypothetical protein B0I37DRAFT_349197 [Chaetomium sp. MPI-CAGE-AT-0009]|nr:hypothetical protein B0I37DRAFT_349197 [Chaetomium sp. MPI-CAGE-AT-0009]
MSSHFQSSGRGGAGNIVDSSKTPQIQAEDLKTPTLKTSMVTTGRGGTGNFAAGLDAEEKRRRQDVEPVVRRPSHGAMHVGRGGTGNVVKEASPPAKSPVPSTAAVPEKPASPTPAVAVEREKSRSPVTGDDGKEDSEGDDVAVPARRPEEIGWAEKGKNLLFGKK